MQKVENNKEKEEISVEDMFKAGAHYGYGKTRRHPSVSSYIYTTKNKTDIIDLEKTSIQLSKASEFIKNLGSHNKVLLFVGTKPEAKEIVKNIAESLNMPYVNERWIGGTLSNFGEIKKELMNLKITEKKTKKVDLKNIQRKKESLWQKKWKDLQDIILDLLDSKNYLIACI